MTTTGAAPAPGADLDATRPRLEAWLRGRVGDGATLRDLHVPEGTGFSSETILFTASTDPGSAHEHYVMRTRPSGHTVFRDYDLHAQFEVMRLLGEHTDVPVPPVAWYEPDATVLGQPFLVMRRVDGVVPSDAPPYTMEGWVHAASADEQRRLHTSSLDVLARLHRVDAEALRLRLLDRPEYGPSGLAQQLAHWQDLRRWGAPDTTLPTLDAAEAWLVANLPAESPPVGLNWGDSRISNMIFRDFEPVALLDWEMAALGPAEVDLGWLLYMHRALGENLGAPPLPGFLDDAEAIDRYAAALGRDVADLHWYRAFAGYRFAFTMLRIAQKVIQLGLPADSGVEDNNLATRALATLLDLPSPGEPGPLG